MNLLGRIVRHHPKHYIIAAAIAAVATLLVLLRDGFTLRIAYANAFTVGGAVTVLIGLLLWTAYLGAFDTFGYSFSTFGNRRYKNLYDYSEAKQAKRSRSGWTFCPYWLVGALFLLIGVLLWIGV